MRLPDEEKIDPLRELIGLSKRGVREFQVAVVLRSRHEAGYVGHANTRRGEGLVRKVIRRAVEIAAQEHGGAGVTAADAVRPPLGQGEQQLGALLPCRPSQVIQVGSHDNGRGAGALVAKQAHRHHPLQSRIPPSGGHLGGAAEPISLAKLTLPRAGAEEDRRKLPSLLAILAPLADVAPRRAQFCLDVEQLGVQDFLQADENRRVARRDESELSAQLGASYRPELLPWARPSRCVTDVEGDKAYRDRTRIHAPASHDCHDRYCRLLSFPKQIYYMVPGMDVPDCRGGACIGEFWVAMIVL